VINFTALNEDSAYRSERITDSLGKGQVHPCVHRILAVDINDSETATLYASTIAGLNCVYSSSYTKSWYDNQFKPIFGARGGWDVNSNASLPYGVTIDTSNNELTLQNAVLDRARGLKADVMLDLIEGNQMWPSIKSIATALPAMAANWSRLRKVIRTASGAFLAWKFGVSPVLQDMMAVHRYVPKITEDVVRHMKGDKQRYSITAELPISIFNGTIATGSQNGFKVWSADMVGKAVQPPTVRYVLVVKPSQKYMTSFVSKADLFMRRFASSPASLAWELVPFSFVLDWFVDLKGVLGQLDRIAGFAPFKVVAFTRSFSYELQSEQRWATYSPCNGALLQNMRACSSSFRHYERSSGVSNSALPNWSPRFGKNQAGISAALIAQQLTKLAGAKRK
jgi:hypothetical protein